jgi:hypothetical protein
MRGLVVEVAGRDYWEERQGYILGFRVALSENCSGNVVFKVVRRSTRDRGSESENKDDLLGSQKFDYKRGP